MQIIRLILAISVTTSFLSGSVVYAQMYKCTDAKGAASYKDAPCANSERSERSAGAGKRSEGVLGVPDAIGLWETTITLRPRVSHPKQNPPPSKEDLDKLGDYKFFFGVPLTIVKCTDKSPIKEYVLGWPDRSCGTQIAAGSGTCIIEQEGNDRSSRTKETRTITGNYRTEMTVKSDLTRTYSHAPTDPVTDQSLIHIKFLGACKPGMKPGDEFVVQQNGEWVKPR